MSATKVPAIPAPTDSNLREVAKAVKGVLDVREGLLGDPLDKSVTFRDLVNGNIVEPVIISRGGGTGAISVRPAPGLGSGGPAPEPDMTQPGQPTGLVATAGLAVVILEWDSPAGGNYAFTEIWRSDTNVIGNAERIGTTPASIYTDSLGATGITRHYWVRHRSEADVVGPYSTMVSATTGRIGNADLGPLIVEAANLANGAVTSGKVDSRGLDIKAMDGSVVFGPNGFISDSAFLVVNGNNVNLSALAASQLVPNLNFVGAFAAAPTQGQLGSAWLQNAVYRNTTDGYLYVLTGAPLGWVLYLEDGVSFVLAVESTNGTTFRVGQNSSTLLKARLFKNGAEVTDVTPAAWFRWRRVSAIPRPAPNDDATWDAAYQSGYKQVSINVDAVYARATFFCDIIST